MMLLGGFLRRLWGAGHDTKNALGLGWLRQSWIKASVILLSVGLAMLGPWPWPTALLVAGLHVLPWWLPRWGESMDMGRMGGAWLLDFASMTARFSGPGAAIWWLTGSPVLFTAGFLPALIYAGAWRWWRPGWQSLVFDGPTSIGEAGAGAVWAGALTLLVLL